MQFWLDPLAASIKKSSAVSMRVGAETMRCGQSLIVWVRAQPMARRDAALAVGFTVLAFTPGLAEQGTALGWVTPQRSFDVPAALLVLGHSLPLAIRHRAPALCLTLISVSFFAYQCLGYRATVASLGLYLALYTAGMLVVRHRRRLLAACVVAYAVLSVCLEMSGSPNKPVEYPQLFAVPAACWMFGVWARTRLRQQEQLQQLALEAAMQDERERIARELHDVVTHHVTAMLVQADALPYRLDTASAEGRQRAETDLSSISTTGRRALADLRELLGVLSPAHDAKAAPREPTAGSLRELVEQTRLVGQPIELVEDRPSRVIDDGTGLVVYRVVQEALTNALKHAPGRRTVVRVLSVVPDHVIVEVRTEGPGHGPTNGPTSGLARGPRPAPSGRGLDGLRRRMALVAGELVAEQSVDGSFVVRATLPINGKAGGMGNIGTTGSTA
ncbi:histidine kinase [Streptomyces sp. NBC_01485]|uniref:sensor histidine kinase n=1 Tax=Streptomyces sp. NBC_01485 TaxID=2903884 RepID=UPI002E36E87D|nr:histidine kinase [Streptomyces sp. NBC_01485]